MWVNKIILPLLFLFLLTGCSNNLENKEVYSGPHIDYSITFDDIYKENIDVYMPTNAYEIALEGKDDSVPPLEYDFLHSDQYPYLHEYDNIYIKSPANKTDEYIHTNLTYNFNSETLKKSLNLNRCFEYVSIHEDDEFISVILTGEFRCMYGDKVIINLDGERLINSNLENNKIEITDSNFDKEISFTISKVSAEGAGDGIIKTFYIIGAVIIVISSLIILILNKKMNEY